MKTWIWVTIIAVVVLGAGAVFWFLIWPNYKVNTTPVTVTPSSSVAVSPSSEVKNQVTDKGVTWIAPKKLDDLSLINKINWGESTYYKIADLSGGGELILAVTQPDGPARPEIFRFKKDAEGKYSYLVKHSDEKDITVFGPLLSKDVLDDYNTTYQSLSNPDFMVFKGTTLKVSSSVGLFTDYAEQKPTLLGETDYGKIYLAKMSSSDTNVGGASFLLVLADSSYASYTVKFPFLTDDGVAQITWKDGTKNTEKFTAEGYVSCGMVATNNIIYDTVKIDTRLTEAGTTDEKDKIYKVSATDVILQKAYENYKTGREAKDILTIDQFAAKNTVFVWKAKMGVYVVFTNSNYGGLAECGKPVIYLYPQKAMNISVKVNADITKSEPAYNGGWMAFAEPNGKLTVGGKTYDSLFWEGRGLDYPAINTGTVVKTAEAVATIESQLAQMGLTQKEIADFVEFWAPKMPSTPYTRLSWFGTKEMNALAPLEINPAPDTLIRVFLDFEGLNAPINITPQKISPFTRNGFTVVEWGGLLK